MEILSPFLTKLENALGLLFEVLFFVELAQLGSQ